MATGFEYRDRCGCNCRQRQVLVSLPLQMPAGIVTVTFSSSQGMELMNHSTSLDSSDCPSILCPSLFLHAEYIQSLKSSQTFAASCGELGRHPTDVYPRFSMYSRLTPCLRVRSSHPQTNHSTGPKACLASPRIVLRRRLFLGPASQSARLLFSSTRFIQSLFHPSHIRRSRSPAKLA